MLIKELMSYMKTEHVPYLSQLTQGVLKIEELSEALRNSKTSIQELVMLYDKHYAKFDGAYKRDLLKEG